MTPEEICILFAGQVILAAQAIGYGIKWTRLQFYAYMTYKAESTDSNFIYNIKQLLEKDIHLYNNWIFRDGGKKPIYSVVGGNYTIKHKIKNRSGKYMSFTIYIKLKSDLVVLTTFYSKKLLTNFIESIHKPLKQELMIFTNNKDAWGEPIHRNPRNITKTLSQYPNIKNIINDIDNEFTREKYEIHGHPYRRGYLITGLPGTGKSTTVEIIAAKYDMPIYIITLNSKEMSDSVLLNLINVVLPHSIIVFDEIDKQLNTIRKKENPMISNAGILQALDGPGTRLSEGSIVIMTANNTDFLKGDFAKPLMRPGRIDKHFEF